MVTIMSTFSTITVWALTVRIAGSSQYQDYSSFWILYKVKSRKRLVPPVRVKRILLNRYEKTSYINTSLWTVLNSHGRPLLVGIKGSLHFFSFWKWTKNVKTTLFVIWKRSRNVCPLALKWVQHRIYAVSKTFKLGLEILQKCWKQHWINKIILIVNSLNRCT